MSLIVLAATLGTTAFAEPVVETRQPPLAAPASAPSLAQKEQPKAAPTKEKSALFGFVFRTHKAGEWPRIGHRGP